MAAWWKKFVAMLTGDQLDRPEEDPALDGQSACRAAARGEGDPPRRTAEPARREARPPDTAEACPPDDLAGDSSAAPGPSAHDAPPDSLAEFRRLLRGLGEAVANLPEALATLSDGQRDHLRLTADRLDEVSARLAALNDALAAALDGLAAADQARGRELAQLIEATQTACEHMQRVREIVASLPEIATAQAESMAGLDRHFETVERRTAAVADAVEHHGRALDEYKDALADMRRSVIALQQGQTELANHQQRIAESLSGLLERTTQMTQLFKASTLKLKQLAEAPQTHHEELRARLAAETERLAAMLGQLRKDVAAAAARGTVALVCSITAALAALAAFLAALIK